MPASGWLIAICSNDSIVRDHSLSVFLNMYSQYFTVSDFFVKTIRQIAGLGYPSVKILPVNKAGGGDALPCRSAHNNNAGNNHPMNAIIGGRAIITWVGPEAILGAESFTIT